MTAQQKVALITGITGQDGSYLAEFLLEKGYTGLDAGTHDSLLEAGQFIATLERRQGLKIACPEEIAWRNGFITSEQLEKLARPLAKNGYGQYLLSLLSSRA